MSHRRGLALAGILVLAACQGGTQQLDSLDDLAGQTVCVGEATTYLFWLQGTLNLPEGSGDIAPTPEGIQATTLPTDIDCAEAWRSGRTDEFQGWLTGLPTAQGAIDEGYPVRLVGDPVFFEQLAVAFDKSVADNDSLVAAVDQIVGDLHADGTLTAMSEQWYDGTNYTVAEGQEPGEPSGAGPACDGETDGHLAQICEAGVIVVSTDPAYPPQSFLNEQTGEYEGFDIDTAREIAERLGVTVEFTDPAFDAVVAGGWGGRWDMSVGSVTVTAERTEVLDFTQAYAYTPAQMAVYDAAAAEAS
jgi:ABC-type amino acid transport substrate-binding protein